MTARQMLLVLGLIVITWGCASGPGRNGSWAYQLSTQDNSPPSFPPDSSRSRWTLGLER